MRQFSLCIRLGLDAASAAVLAFAWRRLAEERVSLVASWRLGETAPDLIAPDERARRLRVEPLSVGAVGRMLQAQLDLVLSRPVLLKVYEIAGGNAFYALELGRALRRRGVAPAPGEPLPVPDGLRDLMRDRLAALPEGTREALTATAALQSPTLALVAAGCGDRNALRPALRAAVLEESAGRLRFAHPLLAATAYEDADLIAPRALHRRLAELVQDEEERARHLALACEGPDSRVAAVLEGAAVHARERGATASAAELSELARQLTPVEDPAERLRLGLHGARLQHSRTPMACYVHRRSPEGGLAHPRLAPQHQRTARRGRVRERLDLRELRVPAEDLRSRRPRHNQTIVRRLGDRGDG